jgi:hypothetical protein
MVDLVCLTDRGEGGTQQLPVVRRLELLQRCIGPACRTCGVLCGRLASGSKKSIHAAELDSEENRRRAEFVAEPSAVDASPMPCPPARMMAGGL